MYRRKKIIKYVFNPLGRPEPDTLGLEISISKTQTQRMTDLYFTHPPELSGLFLTHLSTSSKTENDPNQKPYRNIFHQSCFLYKKSLLEQESTRTKNDPDQKLNPNRILLTQT